MENCMAKPSLWEEMQKKWGNKIVTALHLGTRARKSPRAQGSRGNACNWKRGRKKKMRRHKFGSTLHRLMQKSAHFATGTFIPNISVHQPFFPQDNTNHLKLSNMFTQSLSHMFPWPMCQKTEQLPIKVLLKSSECEPNYLTWCDTIATLSPHHCLILEVLEGGWQSTAHMSDPSNVGDAGIQTNVNNLVWTTQRHGKDIQKRPLPQRWKLKVRQRNSSMCWSKLITFPVFAFKPLSLILCKH